MKNVYKTTLIASAISLAAINTVSAEYLAKFDLPKTQIDYANESSEDLSLTDQEVSDLNTYFDKSWSKNTWATTSSLDSYVYSHGTMNVPAGFYKLQSLNNLKFRCIEGLSDNTQFNLSSDIDKLTSLTSLIVQNCKDISIPANFENMAGLTNFNVVNSNNPVIETTIPKLTSSFNTITSFYARNIPSFEITSEYAFPNSTSWGFSINKDTGHNYPIPSEICNVMIPNATDYNIKELSSGISYTKGSGAGNDESKTALTAMCNGTL